MWSSWWNENWQGKLKYLEKTCPSATFSTTNLTRPGLGSNLGSCDWKLVINHEISLTVKQFYGRIMTITVNFSFFITELTGDLFCIR
jgi:hypothetical protein